VSLFFFRTKHQRAYLCSNTGTDHNVYNGDTENPNRIIFLRVAGALHDSYMHSTLRPCHQRARSKIVKLMFCCCWCQLLNLLSLSLSFSRPLAFIQHHSSLSHIVTKNIFLHVSSHNLTSLLLTTPHLLLFLLLLLLLLLFNIILIPGSKFVSSVLRRDGVASFVVT
jgi:hypothetical protein